MTSTIVLPEAVVTLAWSGSSVPVVDEVDGIESHEDVPDQCDAAVSKQLNGLSVGGTFALSAQGLPVSFTEFGFASPSDGLRHTPPSTSPRRRIEQLLQSPLMDFTFPPPPPLDQLSVTLEPKLPPPLSLSLPTHPELLSVQQSHLPSTVLRPYRTKLGHSSSPPTLGTSSSSVSSRSSCSSPQSFSGRQALTPPPSPTVVVSETRELHALPSQSLPVSSSPPHSSPTKRIFPNPNPLIPSPPSVARPPSLALDPRRRRRLLPTVPVKKISRDRESNAQRANMSEGVMLSAGLASVRRDEELDGKGLVIEAPDLELGPGSSHVNNVQDMHQPMPMRWAVRGDYIPSEDV